jgi:hypothetical protein
MRPRQLLVCLAASCTPELELDPWRGKHLDYDTAPSLQVCAGTHAYMDNYIPFVTGELGIDDLSERPRYRWLTHEQLKSLTGGVAMGHGIALGSVASSQEPALIHELVHTITFTAAGRSVPFFEEGIAMAYSRPFSYEYSYPKVLVDPREDIVLEDGVNYGRAGSFVQFLLANHGPEPFLELYAAVRDHHELAAVEADFRRIYGEELDDNVERYLSREPCTGDEFVVRAYDCVASEVAWEPAGWTHEANLDCDRGDVYGGIYDELPPSNATSVTLEVTEKGTYLLQTTGDRAATVHLGACFGCPWDRPDVILEAGTSDLLTLDPGTYFVRVEAAARVELLRF